MKKTIFKTITMMICAAALFAVTAGAALADDGVPAQDILDKQQQVDKYVFEDHADDIAALGLIITHTSPMDTYVEIGITPYTQESADYLIGIFGSEMVKVVEGEQPIPYGEEIYQSGVAGDDVQAEATPVWVFILIGAAAAAGVAALILVRRKATR